MSALAAASPAGSAERVAALLEPGAIRAVFQPVVRLADWSVIGHEALARPRDPAFGGPEEMLDAAAAAGLRAEVEVACWRAAFAAGPRPHGELLFLNVSPSVLGHPGFRALAGERPEGLVLELTEREQVADFAALREMLDGWVSRGAHVAVDDTGAGFASIGAVLELEPHFVKVAREIVAGVDRDARRRRVIAFLVAYAADAGATLVAEGVERVEELIALRDLGVACAQGYLLARPNPPWPEPSAAPWAVDPSAAAIPGLADAPDVRAACDAVLAVFAERDLLLPSLYLERGGVLRCQSLHGYWQLVDGMPPGAGVIGTVFQRGESMLVEDVGASAEYLEAAPNVRAEACVPIFSGGRAVGAINIESAVRLPAGILAEMEAAATALGERIVALGGLPRERRADRLARYSAALAGLVDAQAIAEAAAVAAADVAELSTAMVAIPDAEGTLSVAAATGPLAGVFRQLDEAALGFMRAWVVGVKSCYTHGETSGRGFTGHSTLRAGGVEAVVVLPLDSGEEGGILVLADGAPVAMPTDDVELLELLAAQAAACLRTAAAVAALSERAARDPLTGLRHHASFQAALAGIELHPSPGWRLAVLLADVDLFKQVNDRRGHQAGDDCLRAVADALGGALRAADTLFRIGGDEFAALVAVTSEEEALAVGRRFLAAARALEDPTVSVGVAVAVEGEAPGDLVARADSALYAAKRGGRDDVALAPAPGQTGALASEAQR